MRQQRRRTQLSDDHKADIREKQKLRQRHRRECLDDPARAQVREQDRLRVRARRRRQQTGQQQACAVHKGGRTCLEIDALLAPMESPQDDHLVDRSQMCIKLHEIVPQPCRWWRKLQLHIRIRRAGQSLTNPVGLHPSNNSRSSATTFCHIISHGWGL